MRGLAISFATLVILTPISVNSAETITYTYDAKGRVIKIVRAGTINNGRIKQYTHDKANNRKTVRSTG